MTNTTPEAFEAPPGPGLADRHPTPEELEEPIELEAHDPEPTGPQHAAAMVSALEEAMVAAGQPRLKDWERMVLVRSLTGLDLSSVDVPQPYRAVVGVSIVAGGRVYKMRQEETEPEEIEQGTPDFGG